MIVQKTDKLGAKTEQSCLAGKQPSATNCNAPLTPANWWESRRRHRDRICKTCHFAIAHKYYLSHKDEVRAYNKKYRDSHKADIRAQMRQKKYNINQSQWEAMLRRQEYRCYSCGGEFGGGLNLRPEIDHEHGTGRIRGLAHGGCNRVIGMLGENPEKLEKIAESIRIIRAGVE